MKLLVRKTSGFTLVELVISLAVLTLILLFSFSIYDNFFDTLRNLRANNLVYEESRYLMNRMVQEVRDHTVDYEEYYNQSKLKHQFPENYAYLRNEIYGQNYCEYSRQFYDSGTDGEIGTLDDQNTGQRNLIDPADGISAIPPAIGFLNALGNDTASPLQNDLFLINVSGDRRVYLKRIEGSDALGNSIGQVGILELIGKDFGVDHLNAFDPHLDGSLPIGDCQTDLGEGDGRIDTWICAPGYPCQTEAFINADLCSGTLHKMVYDPSLPDDSSFVAISPKTLDVVDLQFVVSPMDDPRKAYKANELQLQPSITLKLTVRAAQSLTQRLRTVRQPTLSLNSSISTRIYSEIVSECNLKQCNPGVSADKSCPLSVGVCGPLVPGSPSASQTCTADYLWSGCTASTYQTFSDNAHGLDNLFPGGPKTFYESGSEYQSCDDDLAACVLLCGGEGACLNGCQTTAETCRERRCSDGKDNDCSGAADDQDKACLLSLCSDGAYDPAVEAVESCIDVGGACQAIHPLQVKESVCNDGLDNDCDGFADQFDADCVKQICSNGQSDPNGATTPYTSAPVNLFLNLGFTPKNYLFSAQPTDGAAIALNECLNGSPDLGGLCSACFDTATGKTFCECGTVGCTDNKIVPGHDVTASENGATCSDNLDNDCDGVADELDPDCQASLCSNGSRDCTLVPTDYTPTNSLGTYNNVSCESPGPTIQDEQCADIGGLCTGYTDGSGTSHSLLAGETTAAQCQDGLDNDCDGGADWAEGEGSCCGFQPYCFQNASSTFLDKLESSDFVGAAEVGVLHDTAGGEIRLTDPTLNSRSISSETLPLDLSACGNFDLSLNGTLVTTPGSSEVEFMFSLDNGVTFCGDDDCNGDRINPTEFNNVISGLSGSSLLWRAFLSGDGTNTPTISEVKIGSSNCAP